MEIVSLHVYPLKSARGLNLPRARVTPLGLGSDRSAMLVDQDGKFITQRELPQLAQVSAFPHASMLMLSMEGRPDLPVAPPASERRLAVNIWDSSVSAPVAADSVNSKLSEWFERPVQLVFVDAETRRMADPQWAGEDSEMGFADGYQVLLTTTGSLTAINDALQADGLQPVGMDRFRSNIVIGCETPFEEDLWAAISIGSIRFDLIAPCPRCIMTSQDQRTGVRDGRDPMPAMRKLRMSADRRAAGAMFGWNAVPRGVGSISVGDRVDVVSARPEGWPFRDSARFRQKNLD